MWFSDLELYFLEPKGLWEGFPKRSYPCHSAFLMKTINFISNHDMHVLFLIHKNATTLITTYIHVHVSTIRYVLFTYVIHQSITCSIVQSINRSLDQRDQSFDRPQSINQSHDRSNNT